MLTECINAVVGVDTHRDIHQMAIAPRPGHRSPRARSTMTARTTANCSPGSLRTRPVPRLTVSIEGTRSYDTGLVPRGRGCRPDGDRVRATRLQAAPPQGQVRSDRRTPCGADPRCVLTLIGTRPSDVNGPYSPDLHKPGGQSCFTHSVAKESDSLRSLNDVRTAKNDRRRLPRLVRLSNPDVTARPVLAGWVPRF